MKRSRESTDSCDINAVPKITFQLLDESLKIDFDLYLLLSYTFADEVILKHMASCEKYHGDLVHISSKRNGFSLCSDISIKNEFVKHFNHEEQVLIAQDVLSAIDYNLDVNFEEKYILFVEKYLNWKRKELPIFSKCLTIFFDNVYSAYSVKVPHSLNNVTFDKNLHTFLLLVQKNLRTERHFTTFFREEKDRKSKRSSFILELVALYNTIQTFANTFKFYSTNTCKNEFVGVTENQVGELFLQHFFMDKETLKKRMIKERLMTLTKWIFRALVFGDLNNNTFFIKKNVYNELQKKALK